MGKKDNAALSNRLKRVEGQVRGIDKMILEAKDTRQIVTQVQAAISSLEGVKMELVKREVRESILQALDQSVELLR